MPNNVIAQTPCTGTPPPLMRSSQPNFPTLRQGARVEYAFDSSITDSNQISQILSALDQYNQNSSTNGSNVTFQPVPPVPHGSTNLPDARITFGNGTLTPAIASQEFYDGSYSDGGIASVRMIFNTGGATVDGQPSGDPLYQPGQPGYDTYFLKGTLHGVGHMMGLNDMPQPQTAGASIMNNNQPNCPNNSCGHKPTTIQPCDNSSLQSAPRTTAQNDGTFGSGDDTGGGDDGGGSGGGDGDNCSPQYSEVCGYNDQCDEWDPYTATCTVYPEYDWCYGYWTDCP